MRTEDGGKFQSKTATKNGARKESNKPSVRTMVRLCAAHVEGVEGIFIKKPIGKRAGILSKIKSEKNEQDCCAYPISDRKKKKDKRKTVRKNLKKKDRQVKRIANRY